MVLHYADPGAQASPPAHDAAQIHQYGPAVMSKARSQSWRQNGGVRSS
jgi:hypothetical protein